MAAAPSADTIASPQEAGRLTTHVLDTASGRPAAGLTLRLLHIEGASHEVLKTVVTNADGRCDAPLLSGDEFEPGTYEIAFEVGAYFAGRFGDAAGGAPCFLDTVPVRFRIAPQGTDAPAHLHVPLLISPYGYSTYRGS